ncbi:uncharacterized protein LOC103653756 [Zea mays]|uniref:Sister chromatid cohesion protein PDS5 B-B n=2 Tax=Zea mays TaxID=4577 RepID=K7U603_MAIZE|nr:uncharacterized protein LOC103653756 [Zea mays]AQK53551.1 hypothetical protein ZEAMMB73_Zm00001d051067 [Zea mays]AQK53556.1 hypothetical protein ZEAMMB73_Zm00001d051067 [Zea mays]|eukprot:XP_008678792.1 muscle M-line assembly protein unc-89 isoform X1 [Zea mays]
MAEDPAAEQETRQLEDRLRDVGERLQAPSDDAEDLLNLLIEVEECLIKVEQSPRESISNALRPATEALVKKELLGHADSNVRLAVASCISEITRITAPDAPYDDDAMKDVFSLIVGAFEHLDDIESPFFGRRTSILDTVAKVRSCVVMLDLECDDLINDMFHHFLRTANSGHSEAIISCMETIMRLVIEESEDVQPQIASCLLQNVRKEEKESSPSFELAEKVIGTCREKLKPVFLQSLKGTSLSEYSQIVASVCEEVSDDREDNNANPSGKDMVDDGKLSERTISDELPQESSKMEQDVSRPEQDGTSMNGDTVTAISSGATPPDTSESDQGPPSTNEKIEQPCYAQNIADAMQLKSDHNEGAESNAAKPNKKATLGSVKNTKLKPSDKCEPTVHSDADTKKQDLVASAEGSNGAADDTSRPADSTPKPKRGRPPGPKSLQKAPGKDQSPGLDLKKVNDDSAGKLAKRSAKDEKPSAKNTGEGEPSKKTQKNNLKQHKGETLSEDDPAKDLSLKEMISLKSSTKGPGRTKGQTTENSTPKLKQEQETDEPPRSRKNKGLDRSLVGARIKVWWPDDKMFYNGIVESFDAVSKRHKVAYDDGDVEVLLLREEKWEFISEEKEASMASETPRGRKRKADALKEENTETPKSDAVDPPKKRGRPKGVGSSNGTPSTSATPSTKGKTAGKVTKETPKTGPNLKKELEKNSKDKANVSTGTKDDKSVSKPKEAIIKGKDSKDEGKSTEGKAKPGRKPKNAGTPAGDSDKEKQEVEVKAAEIEEASGNASTGKKRRRKA